MLFTKTYSLQNETRQYLRRLYSYGKELNGSDIVDIDNFIKGCKQLNIWSNLVCWPLRSIHNIGTGSTVLSFGGGGIFDGTLIGSPTWGNTGITFSNPTLNTNVQRLSVANRLGVYRLNSIAFMAGTISSITNFNRCPQFEDGTPTGRNPFVGYNSNGGTGIGANLPNKGASAAPTISLTYPITLDTFFTGCLSKEGSTMRITMNGTTTGTTTTNPTSVYNLPFTQSVSSIVLLYNGIVSFAMLGSKDLSFFEVQTIHNLYKNTLGKGITFNG